MVIADRQTTETEQLYAEVDLVSLYARILALIAKTTEEGVPISQEMMARRLDVTMRTVQRHILGLVEEGILVVERSKKPFQYVIQNEPVKGVLPTDVIAALLTPGSSDPAHESSRD